jgi:hypothetical protein
LLVAERRSSRSPDAQHPLGHGRAAYFWALIASLGVFAVGALLSIHQGIEGLVHPGRNTSFRVVYVILIISFCLDGASLIQAHRQLKNEARTLERTFLQHLDLSSDPVARAVFAEDAAALGADAQNAVHRPGRHRAPRTLMRGPMFGTPVAGRAAKPTASGP